MRSRIIVNCKKYATFRAPRETRNAPTTKESTEELCAQSTEYTVRVLT